MKRFVIVIACAVYVLALAWFLLPLLHSDWAEHSHLIQFSIPDQIRQVEVTSRDGLLLWSIVATNPPTLSQVDYGVLPSGFVQLFPRQGSPRRLASGELFTVALSFPPDGYMRIVTKALRTGHFLHGLTVSGSGGCTQPFCGELFQAHRLPATGAVQDQGRAPRPPNMPLQPTGTCLPLGASRRAGPRQRLNAGR